MRWRTGPAAPAASGVFRDVLQTNGSRFLTSPGRWPGRIVQYPVISSRSNIPAYGHPGTGQNPWIRDWVGALAALAAGLVIGLAGTALGAYESAKIVSWRKFHFWTLVFSVCGSFFCFAIGGWTAGKILGARRAEPAMLHGAIAWLVTIPILLVLASLGAAGFFGVWYGGLAGMPSWASPVVSIDPQAAVIARNSALGALTALLLGLIGSVVGGWRRADDVHISSYPRRRPVWQRQVTERTTMKLVLLWLLGVPFSLIVILFLLGIGR